MSMPVWYATRLAVRMARYLELDTAYAEHIAEALELCSEGEVFFIWTPKDVMDVADEEDIPMFRSEATDLLQEAYNTGVVDGGYCMSKETVRSAVIDWWSVVSEQRASEHDRLEEDC